MMIAGTVVATVAGVITRFTRVARVWRWRWGRLWPYVSGCVLTLRRHQSFVNSAKFRSICVGHNLSFLFIIFVISLKTFCINFCCIWELLLMC